MDSERIEDEALEKGRSKKNNSQKMQDQ